MGPVKAGKYEYRPETLIALRQQLGLKQTKLAELIGVPPNTLSRWETGATKPDAESLAAIYSIAIERGVTPNFFQRRRPMAKRHLGRSRLIVIWDFQDVGVLANQVAPLEDWIRSELEKRFGNSSTRLFKAFGSPYQSTATDVLQERGWRVWEDSDDMDEDIVSDGKSDCGHSPTDTIFVLITKDGDYVELLQDLDDRGVLTYLITPQWNYSERVVQAVSRERWLQIPIHLAM